MSISGSLKPHGLCNMGFFDAFQQWAGENRAKRLRPIAQMKNEVQLELERRQAIAKQLHEQSFRDIAGELEKQRARAESFAQNPDQLLSVTEQVPSWNEADQLALYDAYKRSSIDREKQADSDQAVLAADAFKRGLANITNEAALVNIGMGNEYKPVELEGGVFYNPYDTQNFNLGSTEKHQAETKLEQADSDQAVLAADAFKRGLANITNEAALVNIGMGNEYKPVELEGGVFYNPYDTQNFNLGSTEKHQAETKLEQAEAAEQTLRLERIRQLSDPLMQLNATSNKELGKPMEAKIEGPNGETHKALITQDSNGRYHHSTVTDKEGKPLVIPPEAVGSGSSGLTTDQKNVKYYSQLWGKTEAETAEILKSKSMFSDAGFIEDRLIKNAQGPYGSRNSDKKILTATFDDFVRARHGSAFPKYFIDEINRSTTMKDGEKKVLIAQIENYNDNMVNEGLAGIQPPPPPVVNPTVTGTGQPETAITNRTPDTQKPLWNLDNIQFQQQPGLQLLDMPAPDLAIPQPPAPAPIPEPPTGPDFMAFAETIMTNDSPATINAALKKQGFDLSSQTMGAMAIDAINQGVSVQDIQQFYQLLGIQWTPPA